MAGLPSIAKDDPAYIDQNYWHGRLWSPMIQIVYWALEQYDSAQARGARAGLVTQSKALLLKEWRGYGDDTAPGGSYAGSGRCGSDMKTPPPHLGASPVFVHNPTPDQVRV
jgi:hypothetical protein